MSYQRRRRGQAATVYPSKEVIDRRGGVSRQVDLDSPLPIEAAFVPQRSAKAEVPGQAQIDIMRMLLSSRIPDVDLYSRVYWDNDWWDVAAPPAYHHGTRHTRHWSMDIRRRP